MQQSNPDSMKLTVKYKCPNCGIHKEAVIEINKDNVSFGRHKVNCGNCFCDLVLTHSVTIHRIETDMDETEDGEYA